MHVYVTSLLHETIRLSERACISGSVCLHTCCMNCCVCVCVQLCAHVYLLHNRLAPMWGSKSIIPAAFTYHFTELYVQCKQRLSLHANEPVSPDLHKDSIDSQHAVWPARWVRHPRLQGLFLWAGCCFAVTRGLQGFILQIICLYQSRDRYLVSFQDFFW